jgi:hypothetical protein
VQQQQQQLGLLPGQSSLSAMQHPAAVTSAAAAPFAVQQKPSQQHSAVVLYVKGFPVGMAEAQARIAPGSCSVTVTLQ